MPYKDPERKKEWERLHRPERLARRRELRRIKGAQAPVTRPQVTETELAGVGVGFLVPAAAGAALRSDAAYRRYLEKGLEMVGRGDCDPDRCFVVLFGQTKRERTAVG